MRKNVTASESYSRGGVEEGLRYGGGEGGVCMPSSFIK